MQSFHFALFFVFRKKCLIILDYVFLLITETPMIYHAGRSQTSRHLTETVFGTYHT